MTDGAGRVAAGSASSGSPSHTTPIPAMNGYLCEGDEPGCFDKAGKRIRYQTAAARDVHVRNVCEMERSATHLQTQGQTKPKRTTYRRQADGVLSFTPFPCPLTQADVLLQGMFHCPCGYPPKMNSSTFVNHVNRCYGVPPSAAIAEAGPSETVSASTVGNTNSTEDSDERGTPPFPAVITPLMASDGFDENDGYQSPTDSAVQFSLRRSSAKVSGRLIHTVSDDNDEELPDLPTRSINGPLRPLTVQSLFRPPSPAVDDVSSLTKLSPTRPRAKPAASRSVPSEEDFFMHSVHEKPREPRPLKKSSSFAPVREKDCTLQRAATETVAPSGKLSPVRPSSVQSSRSTSLTNALQTPSSNQASSNARIIARRATVAPAGRASVLPGSMGNASTSATFIQPSTQTPTLSLPPSPSSSSVIPVKRAAPHVDELDKGKKTVRAIDLMGDYRKYMLEPPDAVPYVAGSKRPNPSNAAARTAPSTKHKPAH